MLSLVAVAILATWVTLAILSLIQGQAIGPNPRESLLLDVAIYVRFLVALPLLILSPAVIDPRLKSVTRQFLDAGIISEQERGPFETNIRRVLKLRDSRIAMIACGIIAYGYSTFYVFLYNALSQSTPSSWRTVRSPDELEFSLAGWWYILVALPIFSYFVLTFFYRLFLWFLFLQRTARLDMRLRPYHSDRSAGLGFLHIALDVLWLPTFALCVSVAGSLGTLVLWFDVSVADYRFAVVALVIILVAIVNLPLSVFSLKIRQSQRQYILDNGVAAATQIDQFDRKWTGGEPTGRDMLSVQDFSSLADFNSAAAAIRKTGTLISGFNMARQAFLLFLPFVLVAAMELPIKKMLTQLAKLLL
ncbi:MAG: hypothetical protein GY798_02810 [Hyphomicrobiales bacterium]|nr:hypothetical protein [Hyphomicrobiales bacterium]